MADDIKCPLCGSPTEIRKAKKGSNTGREFYVCIRYPECKGKVEYENRGNNEDKRKVRIAMGEITSDIKWLATFESIRSQTAPIMSNVSRASGSAGEKDLVEALNEAVRQLTVLLEAMKRIPEPSKEEYKKYKVDWLKGIELYSQGCQSHIKGVENRNSLYLNKAVSCFNEAAQIFEEANKWLTK